MDMDMEGARGNSCSSSRCQCGSESIKQARENCMRASIIDLTDEQ
jgi:hypothetical protein